jgi:hypothetical protein
VDTVSCQFLGTIQLPVEGEPAASFSKIKQFSVQLALVELYLRSDTRNY